MSRYYELLRHVKTTPSAAAEAASVSRRLSEAVFNRQESPFVWKTSPTASRLPQADSPELMKLVRALLTTAELQNARKLAFCAVDSGAGGTWVCSRAARMLAEQISGNVCLVDCNFHASTLHEVYGIPNHSNGLADAASRPAAAHEFVTRVTENLGVLTSGSAPLNTSNIVNISVIRAVLTELGSVFDYVLLDLPAVNTGVDAIQLARLSDAAVLVVAAHSTHRNSAQVAELALRSAGVQVAGAVLNRRTFPIPAYLYSRL